VQDMPISVLEAFHRVKIRTRRKKEEHSGADLHSVALN